MSKQKEKIELQVPANIARYLKPDAPFKLKMMVARGSLPMRTADLALALMILARGNDGQLKSVATQTLKALPSRLLLPVVADKATHPYVLDFIVRQRFQFFDLMSKALKNPSIANETLLFVAKNARGVILTLIAENDMRLQQHPPLTEALLDNPHTERSVKYRLGWRDPDAVEEPQSEIPIEQMTIEDFEAMAQGDFEEGAYDHLDNQTKYQMLLDMPIAEKIKMALTGDKEWRSLLIREPNRMVAAAVMKNPRLSEIEVVNIVRNRSSSEELIRMIQLNREWMKLYEVKKGLVYHPRTPLQKAMRLMEYLNVKDIRMLAKSREVSQPIINNARRMVANRQRR